MKLEDLIEELIKLEQQGVKEVWALDGGGNILRIYEARKDDDGDALIVTQ